MQRTQIFLLIKFILLLSAWFNLLSTLVWKCEKLQKSKWFKGGRKRLARHTWVKEVWRRYFYKEPILSSPTKAQHDTVLRLDQQLCWAKNSNTMIVLTSTSVITCSNCIRISSMTVVQADNCIELQSVTVAQATVLNHRSTI